ncbi:hypothetical protein DQ237_15105 [Blastococcus sp. TF02-8]|uniref:hypothetical protein n=1 Tax=Blastococcus sp. TF02-8 TaxID=2250574 RepID=UPI000DE83601|nr:hypothetical protein [Blastococcus sp. TF02-8]RBY95383.1 hypothetical protein DQ237_15105 [Blastococcus sp. TF02-8]
MGPPLAEEWTLVGASFLPLAVVVLADVLGAGPNAAALAGLWTITAILAGWALLDGLRSHLGVLEFVCHVAPGSGVGTVLVAIMVLLH